MRTATTRAATREPRRRGRLTTSARRAVALAAVLLLVSSCGQDPASRVEQERKTVASWAATLHAVCDFWREGSVPTPYAEKTLEAARQAMQEEAQTLQKELSDGTAQQQPGAALLAHVWKLASLTQTLAGAVTREDRDAAQQVSALVAQEEQSLASLQSGVGAVSR
jgi:hypothetical protein